MSAGGGSQSPDELEAEQKIASQWPLHCLVWRNDPVALNRLLLAKQHDVESLDPRGRTPLHLAVNLGRAECVKALLDQGANALALNRHQWSVLHEAVCRGNPEVIGLVLKQRDAQQANVRARNIPAMLEHLEHTPDFYLEMKWEISSWVPFVSRMCPSDTYKIWKKGTSVRVDTTLVGFDHYSWKRGQLTFLFKASDTGAEIREINHDKKTVLKDNIQVVNPSNQTLIDHVITVYSRLCSPAISTVINTDSIAFQRQKSGIWGFRSDKMEMVNGYEAKVYSATGLDIVTRTRVEHLPEAQKQKHKSTSPLQDLLGAGAEQNPLPFAAVAGPDPPTPQPPPSSAQLPMEEYFQPPEDPQQYDAISRPVEVTMRTQKLKANVALTDKLPLSLQEQVLPIIELMSINNAHFAKLKDFITLQMPSGFPIKFEIPLFHVMYAKVTFGNLNGHDQPVPHISLTMETSDASEATPPSTLTPSPTYTRDDEDGPLKRRCNSSSEHQEGQPSNTTDDGTHSQATAGTHSQATTGTHSQATAVSHSETTSTRRAVKEVCTVSDEAFKLPEGYHQVTRSQRNYVDEDEIMQIAIQQSLEEQGGSEQRGSEEVTLMEALNSPSPPPPPAHPPGLGYDNDLQLAVAMSMQQSDAQRRQEQEDEELQRVLQLSLYDK